MTYQRAEQLTPQEAGFYQAILRAFPKRGSPPDAAWLTDEAVVRGLAGATALARLEEQALILRDAVWRHHRCGTQQERRWYV